MSIMRGLKVLGAGFVTALVLLGLTPAGASSANISKSYIATQQIPNGSLVSLSSGKSDFVEPANTSNGKRLIGVSVANDDSLLAVDATEGKVQVATSGSVTVLVSDLSGAIKVGDQISVSPFDGVGMKADTGGNIIGLAQSAFNSTSPGATTREVKDKAGQSKQVNVGYIQLNIGITNTTRTGDSQLNSLQRVSKSLTGRPISTPRLVLSVIIIAVALIILVTLIYSAIYGSLISVGRNPLGSTAVYRALGSVTVMAVVTAITASLAVYFLLR